MGMEGTKLPIRSGFVAPLIRAFPMVSREPTPPAGPAPPAADVGGCGADCVEDHRLPVVSGMEERRVPRALTTDRHFQRQVSRQYCLWTHPGAVEIPSATKSNCSM